jgi:hypothetical protein
MRSILIGSLLIVAVIFVVLVLSIGVAYLLTF